jgi:hypothetical protein
MLLIGNDLFSISEILITSSNSFRGRGKVFMWISVLILDEY